MNIRDKIMGEIEDQFQECDDDGAMKKLKEEVDSLLDEIEGRIIDIESLLNISSVNDLSDIEEAYKLSKKLAEDLY